jgi:serine/threonine protein kinase
MAQIVMALIAFQKAFSLTHNDLHTNNILYKNTDVETLYYRCGGKVWAVPTYGRILKIIDFGRAVYRLGDKKLTSDCFSPKGDAHSQYNTEPYYDPTKPRVEENPSFDLCRLACSIFEYVLDGTTTRPPRNMDRFQTLIWTWCLDDKGRSILYKRNGHERFPYFELYKMIARLVHNCVPEKQLAAHFADFEFTGDLPENYPCVDLDALPVFYLHV